MPKMTAKYTTARAAALKNDLGLNGDQETLYKRLNENGLWWDSKQGAWINFADEPADEPTPKIMVRVWAEQQKVSGAASEVIRGLRGKFKLIAKTDAYPCRPPKQLESRIYLEFLPDDGSKGSLDEIIKENDPFAVQIDED